MKTQTYSYFFIVAFCDCVSKVPLSGVFKLDYNGQVTRAIAHNATADQVEAALEQLPTTGDVLVTRRFPLILMI